MVTSDQELPACVLCGVSSPRVSPVETNTQVKFLQQIQSFSSSTSSFLGLSVTPLCEECACDMTLATANGHEMTRGEEEVRRLQMELLHSLRQLCTRVDKYLEGMRRLEEKVRRTEAHDFGTDDANENAGWLRGAVFQVVRRLSVTRKSISDRTTLPEQMEDIAYEYDVEEEPDFIDPSLYDKELQFDGDTPPDGDLSSEESGDQRTSPPPAIVTPADSVTLQEDRIEPSLAEVSRCDYCDRVIRNTNKMRHVCVWQEKKVKRPKIPREACPECGKVIARTKIKRHMLSAHGITVTVNQRREPPSSKCDLCHMPMKKSELAAHLEGHVGAEYVIRCPNTESCSFACATTFGMQRHLEYNPNCRKVAQINMDLWRKHQITCPVCGTVCTHQNNLRGHLIRYHETTDQPFPCPIEGCELRFTLKESVALHLAHHDVPRKCKTQTCVQCQETIPLEKMADHLKGNHGALEVIPCTHCPLQFSVREHLVQHLFTHRHSKLYCDICGYRDMGTFNLHAHLAAHYFTEHQVGREWRCEECPKVYFRKDSLKAHLSSKHNQNPNRKQPPSQVKKEWKCEDCGHVLKTEEGLRNHKIRQHGAEPLGCKFCPKTFTNLRAIADHEKHVHRGVKVKKRKEWTCSEPGCGATFKTGPTLEFHVKEVHLGEKGGHPCKECGKAFRRKGDLNRHHERVHLGIRKHKCGECGEAFTESQVLKQHMHTHTGERPYACHLCGHRFRQKKVLHGHMKGHQSKGDKFKPTGPKKQIKKRVKKAGIEPGASTSNSGDSNK